jgi:hypothetical protein
LTIDFSRLSPIKVSILPPIFEMTFSFSNVTYVNNLKGRSFLGNLIKGINSFPSPMVEQEIVGRFQIIGSHGLERGNLLPLLSLGLSIDQNRQSLIQGA